MTDGAALVRRVAWPDVVPKTVVLAAQTVAAEPVTTVVLGITLAHQQRD